MDEPASIAIDPDRLAEAARVYDRVELTALEQSLFNRLGPQMRARGHVTMEDIADAARWRSSRASGFVARNDPDEAAEISRVAFTVASGDRVKLKILSLLDGVAERAAATLLAMWDPDRYAPWDERSADFLTKAGRLADPGLPSGWPAYLGALNSLATEAGLALRDAEKAVYVLSRDLPATAGAQEARVGVRPLDVGDIYDEAGSALLEELRAHREGVKDFEAVEAKAMATLRHTTPGQRQLLLRLHRHLVSHSLYAKTSRDLGWLYYARDVGRGLVGELALRMPRGVHEVKLVAYLPVQVSAGTNGAYFTTASQTQQKGHIPPEDVDEEALLRAFEEARRWVWLR
jgi:hypothetical protein